MKTKDMEKLLEGRISTILKTVQRKAPFYGNEPAETDEPLYKLHKSVTDKVELKKWQSDCDDLLMLSIITNKPVKETSLYKSYRRSMEDDKSELAKAMTTGGTGTGAEWIPTDFSRDLIEKIEVERKVAALFDRQTMPTNPFKVPSQTGFATVYKGTEGTAPAAATVGTSQITLDAEKLITYVPVTYEFDEDSIIAVLPTIKSIMGKSLGRAEEDALLNGDDSTTHVDSDITAAADHRKVWKGLRPLAVRNSYTTDVSTFNADTIAALFKNMDEYGALPMDMAWIVGTKVRTKLLTLRDSQNNAVMISMDKLGPNATMLKGMVGEMYGAPVIVSQFMRENLDSDAKYDGTNITKATILLVFRPGFVIGDRRKVLMENDKDVKSQVIDLVASQRLDFQPRHPIATEQLVWAGRNITS